MIGLAQEQGIDIVLIGVPKNALFLRVASFYEELAEENSLFFDGELIPELLNDPSYKSDNVHFNKKGYQEMAKQIHALLIKNGALK